MGLVGHGPSPWSCRWPLRRPLLPCMRAGWRRQATRARPEGRRLACPPRVPGPPMRRRARVSCIGRDCSATTRRSSAWTPRPRRAHGSCPTPTCCNCRTGRCATCPMAPPPPVTVQGDDPGALAKAAADRTWLEQGAVPGRSAAEREVAARAPLDLRLLLQRNGALAGAWWSIWQYAWPRDGSFAAVALARTGHPDESLSALPVLRGHAKGRYVGHSGPLLGRAAWRLPDTYHPAGIRRGTATQLLQDPGVCPVSERGHADGDVI